MYRNTVKVIWRSYILKDIIWYKLWYLLLETGLVDDHVCWCSCMYYSHAFKIGSPEMVRFPICDMTHMISTIFYGPYSMNHTV